MLTCHQFLNRLPIRSDVHGPEPKVLIVLAHVVEMVYSVIRS